LIEKPAHPASETLWTSIPSVQDTAVCGCVFSDRFTEIITGQENARVEDTH
jgi:hypothetical protein